MCPMVMVCVCVCAYVCRHVPGLRLRHDPNGPDRRGEVREREGIELLLLHQQQQAGGRVREARET